MTVSEALRDRIPPNWGGPLNEADYAALAGSWITREIADGAMLRRVDEHQGRQVIGQKGSRDCAGILIPYYWPGEPGAFNYRLRRDHPDLKYDGQGNAKPDKKYLGPPKSGNRLYIPPGVTVDQLSDVSIPIALVEGEKKAIALWGLARHETDTPRFIPIAIAGVWNWRGTIGKTSGSRGERVDVKGPIADLDRVGWQGRLVYIVFDANVQSIDSVKWARMGISRELGKRDAKVDFVNLPPDCGVNGVDDLLAAWGPARVLELFQNSVPGSRLHVVPPPQFESRPDGMFRITTQGERLSQVQLSNYRAEVITNIMLDDGVETKREFEIAAELLGQRSQFTISASEFARMDWPIERLGSSAITFPNQRNYALAAIQSRSMTAEERCIYIHTGWRNIGGRWAFLHIGGAIGENGAVPGVNVRLTGPLSRYELRLPANADELKNVVRSSLRLAQLGPLAVSFPLRAATWRAAFGDCDFSVHLSGETGAFKSELAALEQRHFGAGMDRLHLPGAWSSTANSLEALTFYAKDVVMVIDDFAPQGSAADISRYYAAAERVFRAAGNRSGRGRLDSSARLREPKPPRGLILSTGEEIPRGHSIRARLLLLELSKGAISPIKLQECQRDAQQVQEARRGFGRHVMLGLGGGYHLERFPTLDSQVFLFRAVHRASMTSGRAHFQTTEAGRPERSPESCGWRFDSQNWKSQGDCIGWVDCENIYLEPNAESGLYAVAMGAFIRWIAGRYEERRAALAVRAAELRRNLRDLAHARTAEMIANLQAGFEAFLEFAHACDAERTG
jgi:hypothetical protein